MLVTGLYFVVDGIFVGRGVGTNGLAAVNLAVPFISVLISVTMMITMGGASQTSIAFGQKKQNRPILPFSPAYVWYCSFLYS